jgi:hypothetical protein
VSAPPGVTELGTALQSLGCVSDLFVAGSLASGDYKPGVSDLDLVALTSGSVGDDRQTALRRIHETLDRGTAQGQQLGCAYVNADNLTDQRALHLTWTHGSMVLRTLSGITRAELVRHGYAAFGRAPQDVLPQIDDDYVRQAAQAELASGTPRLRGAWYAWRDTRRTTDAARRWTPPERRYSPG